MDDAPEVVDTAESSNCSPVPPPLSARSLRTSRLAKQDVVVDEECNWIEGKSAPRLAEVPPRLPHVVGHLQCTHPLSVSEGNLAQPQAHNTGLCSPQSKHHQQGKSHLVRSHALCGDDDTKLRSQRGDFVSRSEQILAARRQGSSNASSLSRESSITGGFFTDSTGVDLAVFIDATLHKNNKDRQMLLQLEHELRLFVVDASKQLYRFPPMSSYNRMLVHRVAAYFGLDHNVDQSGAAVVVSKTENTRMPEVEFYQLIRGDFFTDEPKRHLRRDVQSYEEPQFTCNDFLSKPLIPPRILLESVIAIQVRHNSGSSDYGGYRRARSFEVSSDGRHASRGGGPALFPPAPHTFVHMHPRDSFSSMDGVSSTGHTMESPSSCSACDNYPPSDGVAQPAGTFVTVAAPWSSTDSYCSSVDGVSQQLIAPRPPIVAKAGSFGGVPCAYRYNGGTVQMSPDYQHMRTMPRRSNTDGGAGRARVDCEREPSIPEHATAEVEQQATHWSPETPVSIMFNPLDGQSYVGAQSGHLRFGPVAMIHSLPYQTDALTAQLSAVNLDGRLWSPNLVVFPPPGHSSSHQEAYLSPGGLVTSTLSPSYFLPPHLSYGNMHLASALQALNGSGGFSPSNGSPSTTRIELTNPQPTPP